MIKACSFTPPGSTNAPPRPATSEGPGKLAARLLQRALGLRQVETRAAQQIDSGRSDLADNPRHVQLTRRGDKSARLVGCLDCKNPRRVARCRGEELLPQGARGPGELAHGAGEHERWLRSLTQQGDAGPGQHPGVPHGQVDLTRGLEERAEQRVGCRSAFEYEWPLVPSVRIVGRGGEQQFVIVPRGDGEQPRVAAVAQQREIQLRSVQATLTAEMDLHGILGADPDVRNGFSGVKVSYQIDADATRQEIEALVAQSQKRSAVYDIMTNPTSVTVDVA